MKKFVLFWFFRLYWLYTNKGRTEGNLLTVDFTPSTGEDVTWKVVF